MLVFILLWIFLLLIALPAGLNILQLSQSAHFDRAGDRLIISIWLGLAVLSLMLLAASLRFPLSPLVLVVIAAGLTVVSLWRRAVRRELVAMARLVRPGMALGWAVWVLGVAFYSMQPVRYFDTGVYHFGAVRWLSRFGAVTGIALIQVRFGAASSWFALWAPFNNGFLDARITMLLNGLVLALIGFQFLLCLSRCLANRARFPDWFMISAGAFLIPSAVYWKMFVSMAPDIPVVILTVVIAWTILIIAEAPNAKWNRWAPGPFIIPFILAASALTDKLSALCLFATTALFCLYHIRRNVISIVYLCLVGLVFVVPLIAYQTITSGCPFLPLSFMCLDVPWSIGVERATSLTYMIGAWSRWGGQPPPDAGYWDWLWRGWFSLGTTYRSVLAVLVSTMIAAIAGLGMRLLSSRSRIGVWLVRFGIAAGAFVLMFRATNLLMIYVIVLALLTIRDWYPGKQWVLCMGLSGIALALYAAPSFRYNFGYITVLAACIIVSRRDTINRGLQQLLNGIRPLTFQATVIALFIAAGISIGLCRVLLRNQPPTNSPFATAEETSNSLLMPPHFPTAIVEPHRVNNLDYYAPVKGEQCFAAELPCAEGALDPDLGLRDPLRGLSAGFEHKKPVANVPPANTP